LLSYEGIRAAFMIIVVYKSKMHANYMQTKLKDTYRKLYKCLIFNCSSATQDYLSSFGDPEVVGKTAQEKRAPHGCAIAGVLFFAPARASSWPGKKTKPLFCKCKRGALL